MSFDPFTIGHSDIVARALKIADSIVVGIGFNIHKPGSEKDASERMEHIKKLYLDDRRVEVMVYSGLTGEAAKRVGADFLVRGVRNPEDFQYEYNLAAVNRNLSGLETVLIPTDPKMSYVSSSMIRDLIKHGAEEEAKKYLAK